MCVCRIEKQKERIFVCCSKKEEEKNSFFSMLFVPPTKCSTDTKKRWLLNDKQTFLRQQNVSFFSRSEWEKSSSTFGAENQSVNWLIQMAAEWRAHNRWPYIRLQFNGSTFCLLPVCVCAGKASIFECVCIQALNRASAERKKQSCRNTHTFLCGRKLFTRARASPLALYLLPLPVHSLLFTCASSTCTCSR